MSFIEGSARNQVALLPACIEDYVAPDALVRVVDAFEAIVSSNPVLDRLAVEYIKADVLGRLLINDMGQARFEPLRATPGDLADLLRPCPAL